MGTCCQHGAGQHPGRVLNRSGAASCILPPSWSGVHLAFPDRTVPSTVRLEGARRRTSTEGQPQHDALQCVEVVAPGLVLLLLRLAFSSTVRLEGARRRTSSRGPAAARRVTGGDRAVAGQAGVYRSVCGLSLQASSSSSVCLLLVYRPSGRSLSQNQPTSPRAERARIRPKHPRNAPNSTPGTR